MFKKKAPNSATTHATSTSQASLLQRSKIYGLLRRFRYEFTRLLSEPRDPWERAKMFAETNLVGSQAFSNDHFKTIFTPEYRLLSLNLKDPRIIEGHRIALEAIQRMNKQAQHRNIRFIVVLIPTKELVFQELWSDPSPTYRNLTENETVFWEITKDSFERNDIEYIDALPTLREQLAFGVQPYQVSHDGHPNEHGHRAIANLISAYLE